MMTYTSLRLMLVWVGMACVSTLQADALFNNMLHYQIGGGKPLKPSNPALFNLTWKPASGMNLNGNGCATKFDATELLKVQFDTAKDGMMQRMDGITNALGGALSAAPFLILQRVQPDLYDFLLQGNIAFGEDLNKYTASCESIIAAAEKALPADKLTQSAAVESLKTTMSNTTSDIKSVMKDLSNQAGKYGVTVATGVKKGGVNQPPLAAVEEVARSGYNAQFNRPASLTTAPTGAGNSQLYKTWSTPKQASDWIVEAVGETKLQTCDASDGCEKTQTQPGKGLQSLYNSDFETTQTQFTSLVNLNRQLTQTELNSLSTGNVRMSQELIDAIRSVGDASTVERIASEMALSNTLEKSMLARRLLVAGRKEANLTNNEALQTEIDRKLKDLDDETDSMLREMDIRTRLNANTPQKLLEAYVARRQSGTVRSVEPQGAPLRSDGALSQ